MNINKDITYYSASGARLSYVDKTNDTENDEKDFNHTENTENSYNNYDGHSKIAYIKASDSIKAKCGDKEITILDNNGNTNLQKIYIDEDDSFISNLDTLISIFGNNFTEEQAKELCRNIGKAIDATSNY